MTLFLENTDFHRVEMALEYSNCVTTARKRPFPTKLRIFRQKITLSSKKSRTYKIPKNRPFLSEIQNDDAYPSTGSVAGPG